MVFKVQTGYNSESLIVTVHFRTCLKAMSNIGSDTTVQCMILIKKELFLLLSPSIFVLVNGSTIDSTN